MEAAVTNDQTDASVEHGESRRERGWTDQHILRLVPGDEIVVTENVVLKDAAKRDSVGRREKVKTADGKLITSKRHVRGVVEALLPTVQRGSCPPFHVYRGFTAKILVRVIETRGEPTLAPGETLVFMQTNVETASRRVRRLDGSGPDDRETAWRDAFTSLVDERHETLKAWKPLRDDLAAAIAADGEFKSIREALEWLAPETARVDEDERYWRGRWAGSFMCGSALPDAYDEAVIRTAIATLKNRQKAAA